MRCSVGISCSIALLLAASTSVPAQQGAANGEWHYHSGDAGSTKYSPLDQIHRGNVQDLTIAWRRPALADEYREVDPDVNPSNNFRSTPLMIRGVLYASNGTGLVEAFDAGTGRTVWLQELPDRPNPVRGASQRGIGYWRDAATGEERLLVVRGTTLYALELATGRFIRNFGDDGFVDLRIGLGPTGVVQSYYWTSAPLVVGDVVVIGQSMPDNPPRREGQRGDVRAYDVRTGQPAWTFRVIPQQGEDGVDSWENGSWEYTGGINLWSLMSADPELGLVYLPLTAPTSDMYGGQRLGDNLYANSLVAVNAATGERVWHYQIVRHDLWDYDLPAAPILADIVVDGRPIEAVVQLTKQSFVYVFDRATGEPVWPMVEWPVPPSTTPGERTAPRQPIPTRPPPHDRQGVGLDDLIDFTPELRAEAMEIASRYVLGPLFTPPSIRGDGPDDTRGTIQLPGSVGGADWNGAAFDPETGMIYIPSVTGPFAADLRPGDPERSNLDYLAGTREFVVGPRGLPLLRPPYGRITAIDLNAGETVWMVPNGDGPRNHPELAHLDLPPLGQPGRGTPLLTRTLLFVSEGDAIHDRTPPGGGGNKFRAYDKATGDVVWEIALDAGTTGAAMTYMHAGKQYIVVAIGGRGHRAEFIALSLP